MRIEFQEKISIHKMRRKCANAYWKYEHELKEKQMRGFEVCHLILCHLIQGLPYLSCRKKDP
jgi:hypothetical protein